ncbi:histidine--tRNA ligase [Patescibacteria group bacterium]|nr:histidine--tRNA ligase [Patescibacteria group bacterium]
MNQQYKGVRDFYPEDQRVQNYLFSSLRRTVESYGYEEYNASILEPTELYTAKSSQEIVSEQTYTFEDRGGRSVTLRPEMTPTVARMVAARKRELGYPLRLYSIQNFFRYERPQRGRFREFWQLNVDLFGVSDAAADIEMIVLAHRLLTELGSREGQFTIRINDRSAASDALAAALRDPLRVKEAFALIDQKEKLDPSLFAARWEELAAISFDIVFAMPESVRALLAELNARGVTNCAYDPTVVRGFDYYTGMVFEIYDTSGENTRSMFGGGRYDTLVEKYGMEPVPAVGFALGDVTMVNFLETHHLLPPLAPRTQLYLVPLDPHAIALADTLRESGVTVALGMKHTRIADHLRAAEKLGIPFVAVFGNQEVASQELTMRRIGTGAETRVRIDAVHAFLTGQ